VIVAPLSQHEKQQQAKYCFKAKNTETDESILEGSLKV
jgi:hypothetical protein